MAIAVYRTISSGKKLYVSAPTGIGKTISTLFPSVKALGEGKAHKIFYFSAKTVTRGVVEEALRRMASKGSRLKSVTLRAKDKICLNSERACTPDLCEYAKGHFDRVNDALFALVSENDIITADKTAEYASIHRVCPYELSLDAALWCDLVIGDYNHVFDPIVYLRRFFDGQKSDYIFLIDEAHNLEDRVRDMYSPVLLKSLTYKAGRAIKGRDKESGIARKALKGLGAYLADKGKFQAGVSAEIDIDLLDKTKDASTALSVWLIKNKGGQAQEGSTFDELLDYYFELGHFLLVSQVYNECFTTITETKGSDCIVTLFCLDPSKVISASLEKGLGSVLFSATLTPLNYYCEMLGGSQEDFVLSLPSPFDPSRLKTISHIGISTKYTQRAESYAPIAKVIRETVSERRGNYMVFFPSYEYMHNVYEQFAEFTPEVSSLLQKKEMTEEEREEFLERFSESNTETLVGFTVLGGIFSEGIDLTGERLSGVIIVSVGIPMINPRRDLIRDYFEQKNGRGYDYAYVFPGMNKVLQAAGRVIRTETDSGIVLLIDSRYREAKYQGLFPKHWEKMEYVRGGGIMSPADS